MSNLPNPPLNHPPLPAHGLVPLGPDQPGVMLNLAYAGSANFTGQPVYAQALCLLHRDALDRLLQAAQQALQRGLQLCIFDGFRPQEAQQRLWEQAGDKAFVADPALGSDHTRGVAVDLTLADAQGRLLEMGTGFDDMTAAAHHESTLVSALAQANRLLLRHLMTGAGFEPIPHEWWHYALAGAQRYALVDSALLGELNPMRTAVSPV